MKKRYGGINFFQWVIMYVFIIWTSISNAYSLGEVTTVLQNGSNGYIGASDTEINTYSPTTNVWENESLMGANNQKSLFKFDLSSIPAGSTITSATFEIYISWNNGNGGGNTIFLSHILDKNWIESEATWNIFSNGNNWSSAWLASWSDYASSPDASAAIWYSPSNTWASFSITSLVQNWINTPANNYGMLIHSISWPRVSINSSEFSDISFRPKLTVTYTSNQTTSQVPSSSDSTPISDPTPTQTPDPTPTPTQTQDSTPVPDPTPIPAPLPTPSVWKITYYISPSGSDSAGGTTSQSPLKTFKKAFSLMKAGDVLILLDWNYTADKTGYINHDIVSVWGCSPNCAQPPSWTKERTTIIQALNPWKVTVYGTLFIGRSTRKDSYIKIQWITFEWGGNIYNGEYITVKDCGFHGWFSIGTNDHHMYSDHNLVEDVWIWASWKRVIANNYRSHFNVWRRVIIRWDGCGTASCAGSWNPNVWITVYDSSDISLQNVLVIDRTLAPTDSPYSDFAIAQHTPDSRYFFGRNEWLGTISLNSPDIWYYMEPDAGATLDPTIKISNAIGWKSTWTSFNFAREWSNNLFENITALSLSGDGIRVQTSTNAWKVRNTIIADAGRCAFNSIYPMNNINYFLWVNNTGGCAFYWNNSNNATNIYSTNPQADGVIPSLKYLPRIESGSKLKGAWENGSDIGANIVYRYGIDGSFQGENGYNTLTDVSLWPWPNEERIKKEMCLDSGITRWFCSAWKRLDWINNITLTSYIWEYLGNEIPSEIYANISNSSQTSTQFSSDSSDSSNQTQTSAPSNQSVSTTTNAPPSSSVTPPTPSNTSTSSTQNTTQSTTQTPTKNISSSSTSSNTSSPKNTIKTTNTTKTTLIPTIKKNQSIRATWIKKWLTLSSSWSNISLNIPANTKVSANKDWNWNITIPMLRKINNIFLFVNIGNTWPILNFNKFISVSINTDLKNWQTFTLYSSSDKKKWKKERIWIVKNNKITFYVKNLKYFIIKKGK